MCSLSYLPTKEGFILSHNRDELPQRESSSTIKEGLDFYFPQDLKAGGTWMGVHKNGWSACLLNGGSVPYPRKLPYAKSRGTVILNFLENLNLEDFQKQSWDGLEPFTLILARTGELWQLHHDPLENHWQRLNPDEAHFWSSTKLYHPNIREAREARFRNWLQSTESINRKSVQAFHLNTQHSPSKGGLRLDTDSLLNTVSFCQFEAQNDHFYFSYHYLLKNRLDQKNW